jgi:hypothetical protein
LSTFNSTPATNSSKGNNFGYLPIASEVQSYAHVDTPDSTIDFDTPLRIPGDPAAIARHIFRDELADVLKVLHNCGTLHTYDEKLWCLRELARLLDELGLGDRA